MIAPPSAARAAILEPLARRRPTWIEIDLDALEANARALGRACGGRPVWAVVKADAYGHGAIPCARALEAAGVHGLVVALADEGVALRRAGMELPILLSGPLPAGGAEVLVEHAIAPALSRVEDLEALARAARSLGRDADYHLELDTGMTRMGLSPSDLPAFAAAARGAARCHLRTVLSHLAPVSEPGGPAARRQSEALGGLVAQVRRAWGQAVPAHLASSPALCGFPGAMWDMVRPGLLLYGVLPHPRLRPPIPLRPVLSFRTVAVLVRPVPAGTAVGYEGLHVTPAATRIAVIAAGDADGLLRDAGGRAEVLAGGRLMPLVGAVNMDLAQVDAGADAVLHAGDVVTLIGTDGGATLRLEDLSARTGRTPYEWLTGLGSRVPRFFLRGETLVEAGSGVNGMVE